MTTTKERKPLSTVRYLGYGLGDFAFNFYWLPLQVFLLKYYTDVLGLASNVAGAVIMVCLIWDGVIDPAIGLIANKTRSRWGRYRPYLLFGCIPLACSFTLLFFPVTFKGTGLVAYAVATQLLFRTLYAAVNIPYGAMMASMTQDSMERNWLAGTRMFFAFTGSTLVGYFTPRLVQGFLPTHQAYAYFIATGLLSACAVIVTLLSFAFTEEQFTTEGHAAANAPPLRTLLKMVLHNTPFLQVIGGIALFSFGYLAVNTSLPYFIQYYMHQDAAVTGNVVGMVPLVQMISVPFWTLASRWIGKRRAWMLGLLIAIAGVLVLYFVEHPSMITVYAVLGVFSIGVASIAVNFWSMVPDTVEYGEWRSGVRAEGFIFGFVTLIQKVALGVSSAFIGAYLSHIGYVSNQMQSAATLHGIKLLVSVIAGVGLLASCAVIYCYRLNSEEHRKLVRHLVERSMAVP